MISARSRIAYFSDRDSVWFPYASVYVHGGGCGGGDGGGNGNGDGGGDGDSGW